LFTIQIIYTLFLKKVAIIDVLAISSGFVIRVYAGAVLIDAHLSVWFLLCVTASALLLAVGKRKAEISLLADKASQAKTRAALGGYPPQLLDAYVNMFALLAIISYILFSFNFTPLTPNARLLPFYIQLPRPLFIQKWLMITIPVVIYGIMRYLQVIYQKNQGESPERILLRDKPLLFSVVFWVFLVTGIIYVFPY
jgi:4-hydroxybenzoate polyprenyltransferase